MGHQSSSGGTSKPLCELEKDKQERGTEGEWGVSRADCVDTEMEKGRHRSCHSERGAVLLPD